MTKKPKKCRAHVITEAEAAVLNFEPWQGPIDYEKLPTNERFTEDGLGHLITCRFALAAMYKTKAELTEKLGEIDNDTWLALMDSFFASRNFFSHFSELLAAAEARIIVAGSSYLKGADAADRSLQKILRHHGAWSDT